MHSRVGLWCLSILCCTMYHLSIGIAFVVNLNFVHSLPSCPALLVLVHAPIYIEHSGSVSPLVIFLPLEDFMIVQVVSDIIISHVSSAFFRVEPLITFKVTELIRIFICWCTVGILVTKIVTQCTD